MAATDLVDPYGTVRMGLANSDPIAHHESAVRRDLAGN